MRLTRICLSLLASALALSASAIPAILIVRLKPAKGPVLDVPICDFLANELQTGARTVPIVWGLSDPVYRAAVSEGKIRSGNTTPSVSEAVSVAGKLRAKYVLAVDLRPGEGGILGAAYLYDDGKLIWKDPSLDVNGQLANLRALVKKKQMTREEYDRAASEAGFRTCSVQAGSKYGPEDTIRSLARTWVEMISTGPLMGLAKQPEKATPDPGKGAGPIPPGTGATPPKPIDDHRWSTEVDAALKGGDSGKAVSLLRDAIDAFPLDVERRTALIKTLLQMGQPEVAAREARRAAELIPGHVEFRSLAARGWIQAGNMDEAQVDLNEAVTRAPDSPDTRLLLADVAIAKGDFKTALTHLDKAISAGPTGDAYYMRGLAHAMTGDLQLADADVKKAGEAGLSHDPQDSEARYRLVATIFDDGLNLIGIEVKALHSKAQVERTDKEVRRALDDLQKRVGGRSKFISELPVPKEHEPSHNRRVLAYKLLFQCLIDLDSFVKSGDADVLTDSRINLGEALKQGASARLRFKDEQRGTKTDAKSG